MIYLLLALIPFFADTLIGYFTSNKSFNPNHVRYIIALSSGLVISAAFFELLPNSNIEFNGIFLALGFFFFYIVEKFSLLHACGEEECEVHSLGRITALGMASDNIVDGLGIATAFLIDPTLGFIITAAVVSHEVPQAISSSLILQRDGRSKKEIFGVLTLAGFMYPLGALLSFFIPENIHGPILAFVAGVFLYVGAGDLLMEAHRKFNWKVILSVILGAIIIFTLEGFAH